MNFSPDEKFMDRAIKLSRRGYPAPNPHVGCVVVKDGEIVGEGYHDFAGGPHAERVALKNAGAKASGSIVYVTLEPCNHLGRTPPCTEALTAAGVSRVVYAVKDPNKGASGGAETLKAAGIDVNGGLMAEKARDANLAWLRAMERQSPFVVAKVAMSLDGRVALPGGESKWITGEKARKRGHQLRAELGAVLIGRNTAELDRPRLSARIGAVRRQPTRVLIDPQGTIGPFGGFEVPREDDILFTKLGTRFGIRLPINEQGLFSAEAILEELWKLGITSVLIEGGPRTLGPFLKQNLVDQIHLFVSGKVLFEGPAWAVGQLSLLADAPHYRFLKISRVGADLEILVETRKLD